MHQRKMSPQFRRISTIYRSPDGDSVRTYGVEMVSAQAVVEFPDVDLSAEAVDRLIRLLRENDVEGCHFDDVVTDYIERLATP